MSQPYLSICKLERRLATGNVEALTFEPGVNLLVGQPNTGKTKWLQTLDFLLGDSGENPFQGESETGLADKYDAASALLIIGTDTIAVERRWREIGSKTKVFVDGQDLTARDFQHWIMQRLNIPQLNFPRGNPMSGQTWPELSFRMLLRHIYRQQRFWGGLVDQQPDAEQHACILQFLGLAEHIYTDEFGQLIKLKLEVERLKARREQYNQTLSDLARDILGDPGLTTSITAPSLKSARERIQGDAETLRKKRIEILAGGSARAIPAQDQGHIVRLGQRRADLLVFLEEHRQKFKNTLERLAELKRYRADLGNELDRITRAEDAGLVLADLRITHCPACDQSISATDQSNGHCFLCHQNLPDEPMIEELGSIRLRFETDRISSEIQEADQLLTVLEQEQHKISSEILTSEEVLRKIESELLPARTAVSALVQEEISAVDVELGRVSEREQQIERISRALQLDAKLTQQIEDKEKEIEPLQRQVDEMARSTDFDAKADMLEEGINTYLNEINELRHNVWHHSRVTVDISRSSFTIRVGNRRWHSVLGGTDTLYLLMAYQYGLLTLSDKEGCHFPGFLMIDLPADFAGEAIEDKENFIVQPFIKLLSREEYLGAQLIITGAAFTGLDDVHCQHLAHVYKA